MRLGLTPGYGHHMPFFFHWELVPGNARMLGESWSERLSTSKYWPKSDIVQIRDWCWEQKHSGSRSVGSASELSLPLFTLSLYSDPITCQLALFDPHLTKFSGTILHALPSAAIYQKIPVTSKGIPR